jgi:hypothetical protein
MLPKAVKGYSAHLGAVLVILVALQTAASIVLDDTDVAAILDHPFLVKQGFHQNGSRWKSPSPSGVDP